MNILLSGSSGLVGSALKIRLQSGGHSLRCLRRGPDRPGSSDVLWNPENGALDAQALSGVDAVVHLAGESIAGGLWTEAKKKKILDSRIRSTQLLVSRIIEASYRPKVFICASAIGYYGNRGEEILDESSAGGEGFLSDVCKQWEGCLAPLAQVACRAVSTRFGIILSDRGGALKPMLIPFRLGLGGKIGDGRQYMSWVTLDDVLSAIEFCQTHAEVSGPVSVSSPNPVTNAEFTKTLAKVLQRPAVLPLPAFLLRALPGNMGEEMLLASTRVLPRKLSELGFGFQHPSLEPALSLVAK